MKRITKNVGATHGACSRIAAPRAARTAITLLLRTAKKLYEKVLALHTNSSEALRSPVSGIRD